MRNYISEEDGLARNYFEGSSKKDLKVQNITEIWYSNCDFRGKAVQK